MKLCQRTAFDQVEDMLTSLRERLASKGCGVNHFCIDNCCQSWHKLNSVFDGVSIKLDPFHAIQRVVTNKPKKGGSEPLQKLGTQMLHDFKLILRHPTDLGVKRSRPTPSASNIEKNIYNFLLLYIHGQFHVINLPYRILYSLYFTRQNSISKVYYKKLASYIQQTNYIIESATLLTLGY